MNAEKPMHVASSAETNGKNGRAGAERKPLQEEEARDERQDDDGRKERHDENECFSRGCNRRVTQLTGSEFVIDDPGEDLGTGAARNPVVSIESRYADDDVLTVKICLTRKRSARGNVIPVRRPLRDDRAVTNGYSDVLVARLRDTVRVAMERHVDQSPHVSDHAPVEERRVRRVTRIVIQVTGVIRLMDELRRRVSVSGEVRIDDRIEVWSGTARQGFRV
jgi:hypothetical protein